MSHATHGEHVKRNFSLRMVVGQDRIALERDTGCVTGSADSWCGRAREIGPEGASYQGPFYEAGPVKRDELPAGFNLLSGFTHVGQRPVCVSHSTIRRRHILRDRLSNMAGMVRLCPMPKGANTCRRTQPWQTQPAIAPQLPWCSPEGKEVLLLRAGRARLSGGGRRCQQPRRSVRPGIPQHRPGRHE
jgi:hypothetical protein